VRAGGRLLVGLRFDSIRFDSFRFVSIDKVRFDSDERLKIFVGRANRRQFDFFFFLVCSNRNRFVGYIWGVRKNREREKRERENCSFS